MFWQLTAAFFSGVVDCGVCGQVTASDELGDKIKIKALCIIIYIIYYIILYIHNYILCVLLSIMCNNNNIIKYQTARPMRNVAPVTCMLHAQSRG